MRFWAVNIYSANTVRSTDHLSHPLPGIFHSWRANWGKEHEGRRRRHTLEIRPTLFRAADFHPAQPSDRPSNASHHKSKLEPSQLTSIRHGFELVQAVPRRSSARVEWVCSLSPKKYIEDEEEDELTHISPNFPTNSTSVSHDLTTALQSNPEVS